MARLIFLSHSGIDTVAAQALKARIVASPVAYEHGLRVWFDKDDLRVGESWQSQIEEAIRLSHAFAVYVGSKGVVNWVQAEVRLALNRAITEPDYRFIPILARTAPGPESLPGFVRQFQGVCDVETTAEQFDKLMRAVLGGVETGRLALETDPFFGLRAIDNSRSHLFFGREQETEALVTLVCRTPLVLVTGDSGSGKSSLVRAGLIPRFRGGALAFHDGARPEDTIWHVVTMQPRNHPFRQLGDAVDDAAKGLGLSLADRGTLADWAASGDIEKVQRALRCDLPYERVQVLLVVDQFEELLTLTPPALRELFIALLLHLSDPGDDRHHIVLTMRHDYVNLCSPFERLQARLDADGRRARFLLGRVSDAGLHQIVTEPLRLAGIEPADREALAREVVRDVGERPGDLALVQMALTETWQARRHHEGDLLRAYAAVGRVEGALAKAAEHVRTQVLAVEERPCFDSILLRLVRLGDTGGATRRVATRAEFDAPRWRLVQTLASKEGKRLVLLGGSHEHPTVEIAHEALVTAWPYFQNLLQKTADEKRVLDTLIPRAQAWAAEKDQHERDKRLATGADLELFVALHDRHAAWLSDLERAFITSSTTAEKKRRQRERRMARALQAFAVFLLVALVGAGVMWRRALEAEDSALKERDKATATAKVAQANESRALAALAEVASKEHHYIDAVKLAVAAWPRTAEGDRPKLHATIKALGTAQRLKKHVISALRHEGFVEGARFNRDETRILTWSGSTAQLWDVASGEALVTLRHQGSVEGARFNRDETRILTWSGDGTAQLWDIASGKALVTLRHQGDVRGARFNRDETRILTWSGNLTWSRNGTAQLWDVASGKALVTLRHQGDVRGARFNRDETRILTCSGDGTAQLWDVASGKALVTLRHQGDVRGARFNRDETRILTCSGDGTAQLWDVASGKVLVTLRHQGDVRGARFNRDETRILTWSMDGTAQLWDVASGKALVTLRHQGLVMDARFNRDETRILTWSRDGTAQLWDVASGKALVTLRHQGDVRGARFNRDETRILTCSGSTAQLWDVASGEALVTLRHQGLVWGARFNRDETRILTWSGDGTAQLWDIASGKALVTLRHQGEVRGALFNWDETRILINRDETRILTWSGSTAQLWDVASGKALVTLRPQGDVWGARFNRDETRILTWSMDGTAQLWDVASGKALVTLRHQGLVMGALFNWDETRILTWSMDGTAQLWDVASGKALVTLRHQDEVRGALFNRDETRILTWSKDDTAQLWDVASGKALVTLRHQGLVMDARFNRDETRILTWSANNTAQLWDIASAKVLVTLRHQGLVMGARFNRDETRILTWSANNTAQLWDVASAKVLVTLRHQDLVRGARFNRDETRILTWSMDGTAQLWDVASGEALVTLRHQMDVWGALFNRDETRILTWSGNLIWSRNGTAQLWDISRLPHGHLIQIACGMLSDYDTSELKERYGIAIVEPICSTIVPVPVQAELED